MSGAVPAVVLAGGQAGPEIAAATGVANRALLEVDGATMLDRVVAALAGSGAVGEVVVVGSVPECPAYRRVPDTGGLVGNVLAGVDAVGAAGRVLIATSDIPFLTAGAVADTLAREPALDADLVYPIVPVSLCRERYPGMHRTSVRLRDGTFTGGNLFVVRPAFVKASSGRLQAAYESRKAPLRLAAMIGAGTVLRLLLARAGWPGILSVAHLEGAVSRLLGGRARALLSAYPELAADVDRYEDLQALRRRDPAAVTGDTEPPSARSET